MTQLFGSKREPWVVAEPGTERTDITGDAVDIVDENEKTTVAEPRADQLVAAQGRGPSRAQTEPLAAQTPPASWIEDVPEPAPPPRPRSQSAPVHTPRPVMHPPPLAIPATLPGPAMRPSSLPSPPPGVAQSGPVVIQYASASRPMPQQHLAPPAPEPLRTGENLKPSSSWLIFALMLVLAAAAAIITIVVGG